jgi:hypothetical protein
MANSTAIRVQLISSPQFRIFYPSKLTYSPLCAKLALFGYNINSDHDLVTLQRDLIETTIQLWDTK